MLTVRDLIELLEAMDPDADVEIVYQPNWPMAAPADTIKEVDGTVYIRQDPYGNNGYAPDAVYGEEEN